MNPDDASDGATDFSVAAAGTSGGAGGGAGAGGEPLADGATDSIGDDGGGGAEGRLDDAEVDRAGDSSEADRGPPCPTRVVLVGETETPRHGDDSLGNLSPDRCPDGQAVIGYVGLVDSREPASIGELAAFCGTVGVEPNACRISVRPGARLPQRGSIGDMPFVQTCPADQVVVGSFGRSGDFFNQIGFSCAPLVLDVTASGYRLSLGAVTALVAAGGDGGDPFVEPCPAGQIARGSSTRVFQGIVGSFGLLCTTPTLAP